MHQLLTGLAGLGVGFVVGLTGMGGGALMTPILVLFFGINPASAVSSDLVAALVMKPVGGAVHLRRGTVHRQLAKWLCIGSIPAAFGASLLLHALGDGATLQDRIGIAIGIALLLAVAGMLSKTAVSARRPTSIVEDVSEVPVRRGLTVAIGVFGGLVVGLTSVGSGSLMLVLLLVLYPALTAGQLVGTDLVQAVPLVGAAALGHVLFGNVQLGLTLALIVGAVPGVYVGARLSAKAPDRIIRTALMFVLTLSGLKLLGVGNVGLAIAAGGMIAGGFAATWAWRHGLRDRLTVRWRRPRAVIDA